MIIGWHGIVLREGFQGNRFDVVYKMPMPKVIVSKDLEFGLSEVVCTCEVGALPKLARMASRHRQSRLLSESLEISKRR